MGILDRFRRRGGGVDALSEAVAGASRVRCRRPDQQKILYETSDRSDIAALAAALQTEPRSSGYCLCRGTLELELDGAEPRAVTLHHGVSLRWHESGGNLVLLRPDAVMDWLSSRGMHFVREEYDDDQRRGAESANQARSWRAVMPASLRPFFDEMRQSGGDSDPAWTAAIEAELPDPIERARVLLDLFGSGAGRWTGYPSWESIPEHLLLRMPLAVLLAAIGDAPDARRREGAARLFSSWWFARERRGELAGIPDPLRRLLLDHIESSPDDDKRRRARAALART